jgi:hypothetical protein
VIPYLSAHEDSEVWALIEGIHMISRHNVLPGQPPTAKPAVGCERQSARKSTCTKEVIPST